MSLLVLEDGVFEVKATAGNTHLGGQDFDMRLVNYLAQLFKQEKGSDLTENKRAIRKLMTHAENLKKALSSTKSSSVEIDALHDGHDFRATVTRAKFENLCMDLFAQCLEPVEKVLKDSGIDKAKVDEVVMVGGSTRFANNN